ncbi:MAG: class I SAM-dependent methyltransferase [Haliea sp.]|nr:class I SAM-dependent methyltransferase [Haliea sp.]MBK6736546.1 class I SAM-dependent methyltransferase [Haliea sp.]
MSKIVDGIISKQMEIPKLYHFVQKVIAGPLHKKVEEMMVQEMPDITGRKVLDVGCGLGNYSTLFSNAQYTGFDLSPAYIDYANLTFNKSNTSFSIGNAVTPPSFSENFDFIFSVGLYHHISDEETIKSLKALQRMLAEAGSIFIVDAVFPKNFNVPGYVLRKLDRGKHVRSFRAYKELLEDNFVPTAVDYHTAGVLDFIVYKLGV